MIDTQIANNDYSNVNLLNGKDIGYTPIEESDFILPEDLINLKRFREWAKQITFPGHLFSVRLVSIEVTPLARSLFEGTSLNSKIKIPTKTAFHRFGTRFEILLATLVNDTDTGEILPMTAYSHLFYNDISENDFVEIAWQLLRQCREHDDKEMFKYKNVALLSPHRLLENM